MTDFSERFWTMVTGFVVMAIPFVFDGMPTGYKVLIWIFSSVGPLGVLLVIDAFFQKLETNKILDDENALTNTIRDLWDELTWDLQS